MGMGGMGNMVVPAFLLIFSSEYVFGAHLQVLESNVIGAFIVVKCYRQFIHTLVRVFILFDIAQEAL